MFEMRYLGFAEAFKNSNMAHIMYPTQKCERIVSCSILTSWFYLVLYIATLLWLDLFVGFAFVVSKIVSRRKGLVAEVTWNTYSLQMISLNVLSY